MNDYPDPRRGWKIAAPLALSLAVWVLAYVSVQYSSLAAGLVALGIVPISLLTGRLARFFAYWLSLSDPRDELEADELADRQW